jgi:hypothetical protein
MAPAREFLLCTECIEGRIVKRIAAGGIRQTDERISIDIILH